MTSSFLIGFFFLLLAAFLSISSEKVNLYFQLHSVYVVALGTIAVMFLSSPTAVIAGIFKSLKALAKKEESISDYEEVIKRLSKNKTVKVETHNPILRYAMQLWEQGVGSELFIVLLSEKRNELDARNVDVIHALKNLAKYPPALGMVGTVMGMIDLFASLDKNQERIGEALSIAMTATFLGLILSNMVISPLADRLHVQHIKEQRLNTSLYEVLLLINSDQPMTLIDEEMKTRAA